MAREAEHPREAGSMAVILLACSCTHGTPRRTDPSSVPALGTTLGDCPSALRMLVGAGLCYVPREPAFPPPCEQGHGAFPHCSATLPPILAGGFN